MDAPRELELHTALGYHRAVRRRQARSSVEFDDPRQSLDYCPRLQPGRLAAASRQVASSSVVAGENHAGDGQSRAGHLVAHEIVWRRSSADWGYVSH